MTNKRTCPACGGKGERLYIDYERCYPACARMAVGPCESCGGCGYLTRRETARIVTSAEEMVKRVARKGEP